MVTLAFAQAGSVLVGRNPGGATGGEEGLSLNTEQLPDFLVGVVNTRNLYWLALAVLILVFAIVTVGPVHPGRPPRRGRRARTSTASG